MTFYCLQFRKNIENINPKVSKINNGKTMMLSKCAICVSKKQDLLKNKKQKEHYLII